MTVSLAALGLDSLVEKNSRKRAVCKGAMMTRLESAVRKRATARKELDEAKAVAWKRSKGRCERCGKRVKRGGGLIDGAEFNHTTSPERGGRKVHVVEVVCHGCHFSGPSGAHRRHK